MAIELDTGLINRAVSKTQERNAKYEQLLSALTNLHRDLSVRELLSILPDGIDGKIRIPIEIGSVKAKVCIGMHDSEASVDGVGTWFEILEESAESSADAGDKGQWEPCECDKMLVALGIRCGTVTKIESVELTVKNFIEGIAQKIIDDLEK
jgi:hypothetical protein